jgi:hypothetical protein
MSDIAKCEDFHCPSKLLCHRFTAPADEIRQSYGKFNREADAYNCDMFWPNGACKYCGLQNDNHKLSCPVIKTTMLL